MTSPENVIVVGGSIAGPATANYLAGLDIHSTLILGGKMPEGPINLGRRTQVPVTKRWVMEELGADTSSMASIEHLTILRDDTRYAMLSWLLSHAIGMVDLVAPDTVATSRQLLHDAAESPLVDIVEAKVTDIKLGGKRAKPRAEGVYIGDDLITGSAVLDATGGKARIAEMINKQKAGAIAVSTQYVPTTYFGGYVTLDERVTGIKNFHNANRLVSVGLFSSGMKSLFAPHHLDGSNATHLLLASGPDESIRASRSAAEALPNDAKSHEAFQARLRALYGNTMWRQVVDCIVAVERLNTFKFTDAYGRIPVDVENFAMMGDSGGFHSPAAGAGIEHAARDIVALGHALLRHPKDHGAAVGHFNATRRLEIPARLNATRFWAQGPLPKERSLGS